jgi:hypothetical protein
MLASIMIGAREKGVPSNEETGELKSWGRDLEAKGAEGISTWSEYDKV